MTMMVEVVVEWRDRWFPPFPLEEKRQRGLHLFVDPSRTFETPTKSRPPPAPLRVQPQANAALAAAAAAAAFAHAVPFVAVTSVRPPPSSSPSSGCANAAAPHSPHPPRLPPSRHRSRPPRSRSFDRVSTRFII